MNRQAILIGLSALTLLMTGTSYAKEPKNLDLIKASLIKYHDSGEYQKDQAKVTDHAMEYLKTRLQREEKTKSHKKLAIVLDIDDTSLSNYALMLQLNFGKLQAEIAKALAEGNDPAIASTLELYRYAKANNVAVFFITGRPEHLRAATEKNLANVGFKNWDGVSFRAEDYKEKSIAPYKTNVRNEIEKQGYDIVLNVGDQQSDLSGGHADKAFKLPNPYYLIP